MYSSRKINVLNFKGLLKVTGILYRCGKDMKEKQGLCHWDNSWLKTFVIVMLCSLKNTIYLVYSGKQTVGTFQINCKKGCFKLQKLATDPAFSGKGVGSFSMNEIERIADSYGINEVCLEVYDKATHAVDFYKKRGYDLVGETKTLKYRELIMKKKI